jgi:hypothetical protein
LHRFGKGESMKNLVIAAVFACLFSTSALAGDIPTSDVAAPQPPPTHSNVFSAQGLLGSGSKQIALDSLESLLFALLGPMFR